MKLSSIFDIQKPKTTVKNHFEDDRSGINFVSSGEKNNGVSGKETVGCLNTDFTEEKYGGGAGCEPAILGL